MGKVNRKRQTQKNRGPRKETNAKRSIRNNLIIRENKSTRRTQSKSKKNKTQSMRVKPRYDFRKITKKQGQYRNGELFSATNYRGSTKTMGERNYEGRFLAEINKSNLINPELIIINETSSSTNNHDHLQQELKYHNQLSKIGITPKISDFVPIKNTEGKKHSLRAFYVERKTPLTKFNPKTSDEVITALKSVLKKATEMVDKKGFIHTDMKEDNLVIDIGKIHKGGPNKGLRRIEIFFIDVSPIFFTQLFDPKQSNNKIAIRIKPNQNNASKDYSIVYDIKIMKKIVPFITLCQLVLSPSMDSTNVFGLSKIQTDAMELEINEGIERDENEHFIRLEMIATLMRKYITDNDITFELFTKYLNGINYIMQSQGKHFSLTTMMYYYLFEDKDVTNHDAQYNVNNQIGELIASELQKYQILFIGDED